MKGIVKGFLKRSGQLFTNGAEEEVLLRGVGFGNWMLPEGYMWRFGKVVDRPRRIEAFIEDLIGTEEANRFWERFHHEYITESDIIKISDEGYNSVRLPINARFIMDEETGALYQDRFFFIDRLIDWCRAHKLYVFLDLHGAPGGQTGANIDDSKNDHPELFTIRKNMDKTIALWKALADRYKDEWIVGGYDLLNEPLPNHFNMYNDLLEPLHKEITQAIRSVDNKHLIIVEGAHWATDFSVFTEVFDDNMALQFHKYWSAQDTASIQKFLDKREALNLPLWMGEGGENNHDWIVGAFQLYEDHNISWNFWPWKKLDTYNSPCSINKPQGWDKVIAYANGGPKPSREEALEILIEYLDNIRFENCTWRQSVVNAMMRRAPVRIPAEFYGFKGQEISWHFNQKTVSKVKYREEDGAKISFINPTDAELPAYHHGDNEQGYNEQNELCVELHEGEWLRYNINAHQDGTYDIHLRAAGAPSSPSSISIELDGRDVAASVSLQSQDFCEYRAADGVWFASGSHDVKIRVDSGIMKLHWISVC